MDQLDNEQKPTGEIILFQSEDGQSKIQVRFEGQTVWLAQRLIAELYQVSIPSVNEHLTHIYEEGELQSEATIRKFRIVQSEGKRSVTRFVDHYNLDAILAVGYRVRSHRGTQFRQWATNKLREFLVKGFVLDDERLKEGQSLGADYFDELLARIRDIRSAGFTRRSPISTLQALITTQRPTSLKPFTPPSRTNYTGQFMG